MVETNAIGEEITGTRTLYEPYGTPLTTPRDGAPSYTGHPYDTGTGLIYAQQRYYDPLLGVFMSPDPMAVDTTSAFNFNRYAYANNSPYKFTDPDGRFAQFLWGAVIGAGVEVFVQTAVQGKSFSDIDLSDVAVAAGAGALTGGIASGAALAAARGSVSVGAAVAQTAVGSGAVAVNASLASDVFNGEAPDAQAALVDGATAAVTAGAGQRLSLGRLAGIESMSNNGGLGATVAETTRLANQVGNDSVKLAAATSAAGSNAAEYGGLAVDAAKAKLEEELK